MEYQPDIKRITGEGGVISRIIPNSIAAELGLQPGDVVVSAGDQRLRDVIDYRFATAEEQVELLVRRGDDEVIYELEKDADDDLGIEFTEPLFDRLRTCNNKCPFCFLTQMPKGMRKTLYLKDDDFRLSFLYGNFVTLTNLSDDDWSRIEQQRLSPMYVSIHATDRTLRAVLLGKADVPDVIAQIRQLGEWGITVHTQVVACPGVNDDAALHETVQELAALFPVVQSIAVVPVGLTKYRFTGKAPQTIRAAIRVHESPDWIDTNWERQPLWRDAAEPASGDELGFCARLGVATDVPLRTYRPDEAARVIDLLLPYAERYRDELGAPLVYPSDEFYLLCGRELPPAEFYGGYPQYSNGVGMTRDFLDDWAKHQRRLPARLPRPARLALLCGTLIAPTMERVVARLNRVANLEVRLVPVTNQFFGETVTVSGLLMGQDIVPVLRDLAAEGFTRALLPRVMFDHAGERTLDEYSLERIAAESGVAPALAGAPDEVARYVRALSRIE
jgi:NifB/MoaA-like Fe-S oxidoreductase